MIVLAGPQGKRYINPGQRYRLQPGERVIGSVREPDELDHIQKELGLGDAIAMATKALGIKPCPACTRRIAVLNRIRELGLAEATKQILETFKRSD